MKQVYVHLACGSVLVENVLWKVHIVMGEMIVLIILMKIIQPAVLKTLIFMIQRNVDVILILNFHALQKVNVLKRKNIVMEKYNARMDLMITMICVVSKISHFMILKFEGKYVGVIKKV